MKLPSLHTLLDKSFATLIRFPLVMLAAAAGTYFSIRLADLTYDDYDTKQLLTRNLMTASLALTLFLSVKIFGERKNYSVKVESILHLLPLALIIIYYVSFPSVVGIYATVQFVLFNIGLHLLVSISPFIGEDEPNGFWQYNKALFLRFLTAALYSAVLYVGLSLALLAIDKLFEVYINGKWYFRLWIFIAGIVNTWLFLAGIPHNLHELEKVTDYPKGLKIFTQYILLPIITVYMLILYGYEIKILVTSHWPVGWVSYLVLAFSIAGILSLLLIWPLRENDDSTWIKSYSRFFYIALFPLIAMLFIAIFKRVSAYGITENRYFIIVLALWLTCISLYFVFSNRKNIRLIPTSLCIIAFLSSFGPWGAFSISKKSQFNRLYSLLDKNQRLKEGKVQKSDKKISFKDRKYISSIVEYMVDVHGVKSMQPLFADTLNEQENRGMWGDRSEYEVENDILDKKMGVIHVSRYQRESDEEAEYSDSTAKSPVIPIHSYSVRSSDYTDISGYDVLFNLDMFKNGSLTGDSVVKDFILKNQTMKASVNFTNQTLKLYASGKEIFSENLREIEDKMKSANINDNDNLSPALTTVEKSSGQFKVKVIITRINVYESKNKSTLQSLRATVLLKKE